MNVTTLLTLSRTCEPGQIEFQANTGKVWFTEFPGEDERRSADVTALIDSMEGEAAEDILTACSDYVFERFCVDCASMSEERLTLTDSELTCFADVNGEHVCGDCAAERFESTYDDYTRNGVMQRDFY